MTASTDALARQAASAVATSGALGERCRSGDAAQCPTARNPCCNMACRHGPLTAGAPPALARSHPGKCRNHLIACFPQPRRPHHATTPTRTRLAGTLARRTRHRRRTGPASEPRSRPSMRLTRPRSRHSGKWALTCKRCSAFRSGPHRPGPVRSLCVSPGQGRLANLDQDRRVATAAQAGDHQSD